MAMTSLAVAADDWVQATVGDSTEVTLSAVGACGLFAFIGAAEPAANSKFGVLIERNERVKLPIGASEQVWLRPSVPMVATTALVLPHPVAA